MQKKIILLTIFLFLSGIFIFSIRETTRKQNQVCFKNYCFNVELAVTAKEQMQGLMFRKSLARSKGMLFIFNEEGLESFWMKNTLIPLDIIWINENKEVVFVSENTQPCKENSCPVITPDKKAKYVLEINGGISKEIGLREEEKLEFDIGEK